MRLVCIYISLFLGIVYTGCSSGNQNGSHRGAPFTHEQWDDPDSFGNKREELAQYYQSVSRIDQGLGKLMAHLEDAGKTENTIVIYISDNGIAFPGAKTTLYEPGLKFPCIVKNPYLEKKGMTNND